MADATQVKLRTVRFDPMDDIEVDLAHDERIVNVETSPAGASYVWIANDWYRQYEQTRFAVEAADLGRICSYGSYD